VDNDKRTELAIVVIAAVVVGMIAVAYPASVPVMGIVVAVVALVLVWLKL
jgi:cytochrome c oxidase assembly protein Cox11